MRVNLGEIVRRIEPMLQRLIGEEVNLATVTPPETGYVLADPSQIEQVIVNLVVNARDAMPNGGTVRIETADSTGLSPAGSATLSVTDTGIGMDSNVLSHLFEPFFTTKEKGKGTGLGLATVYGIVHQSGGTITATSTPGKGSTFTVSLPLVEPDTPADAGASAPAAAEHGRNGTILVVEDDRDVRRLSTRILQAAGYRVLPCSTGAAAMEIAGREPVDLLLTDVVMSGMGGRDVASRLVSLQPGVRILFMSGHTDKGIVGDMAGSGAEFLAKPFSAEDLLAAVWSMMREAGLASPGGPKAAVGLFPPPTGTAD